MVKEKAGYAVPAIKCFVNTGAQRVPLGFGRDRDPISCEKPPGQADLTYGQYLDSVSRLMAENSFEILRKLLRKQKPVRKLEESISIELTAEKYGALYSVSRLLLRFGDESRQFAVNCAFSPEQQAFLQVEAKLLTKLRARFGGSYLPQRFLSAGAAPGLMLFIAEWFENHHEFHLSKDAPGAPAIRIWKEDGARKIMDESKVPELYAQASKILTYYLDPDTFSQIYPWHHGAGDFIIDDSQTPPSLRLITVRGYRSLLSRKSDCRDKMLGALHFFVNLCIRMRIDRLDGVGELAWAGPHCLRGVVRGFMEGWETEGEDRALPKAREIFSLFKALSSTERLGFAEAVARDGMVEAGEGDFLFARLPGCMGELANILESIRR